ncbi:MAG: hypothetical protein PVJ89_07540 [Planctomycetota bacterium]
MVHLGSPEDGARFFEERWPEARAVSDPDRVLFDAFGLGRGSWLQLVGPRTWAAGFRARRHGVGLPKGDPRVLAGSFAVKGAEVLDADLATDSSSVPDLDRLAATVRAHGV